MREAVIVAGARTPVGKEVKVKVLREGSPLTLTIQVGELKDDEVEERQQTGSAEEDLGLSVQVLTYEIAESLGLPRDLKGLVVSRVTPGSAADEAGLRRGDVILEVNREPVKDLTSFRKALKAAAQKKSILLLVRRGDNTIFIAVKQMS